MSEQPLRKFVLASGNFFFKYRNGLFPATFVFLFLFTRPAFFLGNPDYDKLMVAFASLVALAGGAFRLAVIGYAYIKRGGKEGKVYADNLVVRGFYNHTRNPMYVGNFLIMLGLSLVYGAPCVYYFVIPFFSFVYYSIIKAEEHYLHGKFGAEYEDYCRRVSPFWPNFKGLGNSLKEFTYDWRRALRKDYGTVFGLCFGLILIQIWKLFYLYGFESKRQTILQLAVWMLPVLAFYGAVRYFKLTGKLVSASGD